MLQSIFALALGEMSPALLAAMARDARRDRRIEFAGSADRLMARKGEHTHPRAGSIPGGVRRRRAACVAKEA